MSGIIFLEKKIVQQINCFSSTADIYLTNEFLSQRRKIISYRFRTDFYFHFTIPQFYLNL
jgi:hypothetical protein